MQRYTVYFIWKLLYMFRVVSPPIIRSAYNCIYIIWYLSHHYCYLPLSWKSWNCSAALPLQSSSNSSTIAAGSGNGVTNTRCCRYSCRRSWRWVEAEGKVKDISYLCLLKHHAMQPYGEVYFYVYPCVLLLSTTLRWAISLHLLLSRRNRDSISRVLSYWIPVPILTSHMFSEFRLSLSWPYSYAEQEPSVTPEIKISHRHN